MWRQACRRASARRSVARNPRTRFPTGDAARKACPHAGTDCVNELLTHNTILWQTYRSSSKFRLFHPQGWVRVWLKSPDLEADMKHFPLILVLSLVYPVARAESAETGEASRVVESSESGTAVVMLPGPRPAAKPTSVAPKSAAEPAPKPEETKIADARSPEAKRAEPAKPAAESSVYFPKLIGFWKLADARRTLGEPIRQRPSLDADKNVNGQIYAFPDPSNHYKEVELEFAQDNGMLRAVFIYPAQMTWNDCRRLWGVNVNATQAGKGRTFYSYNNRHLDVLVDTDGKVISLGLY